jgi:hypothetical protein
VYGLITGFHVDTFVAIPGSWIRLGVGSVGAPLPTTVDDTVVLGKLTGTRSSNWAWVSLTAQGIGISIARQYLIGRGYNDPGAGWLRCLPLTSGQQFVATDDFDLDLLEDENDCWLRVRRTVGSTAAEFTAYIETNAVFAAGGAPPGGTVAGIHQSTAASQRNGLLYATGTVLMRNTAPADSDLETGQCGLWFDPSSASPQLMLKARDASSNIVTGSVKLA